ncbi:MAG: VOC family protein [Anaerolineae bacterium]|nr:VOC family protein [Anaerolineae bacterium]MBN8617589.1 VOC family protein [Anaerolineae bacterium]
MIKRVGTVSVFVSDQDRAKQFYTETLGLELHRDQPLFPGAQSRWLSVAPKGAETEIVLYLPDENWEHYRGVVGKSQAVTLDVSDIEGVVGVLKQKGVVIVSDIDRQPWGSNAIIQDSEGNHLLLVEQAGG